MLFPRQKYWSGLPFPSPGDIHNPGIKPMSSALQADSLPLSHPGSPSSPYTPLWDSASQEEEGQDQGHQLHRHQTQLLSRLMTAVAVLKLHKRKIKQDLHEAIKPLLIPKTGSGGWNCSWGTSLPCIPLFQEKIKAIFLLPPKLCLYFFLVLVHRKPRFLASSSESVILCQCQCRQTCFR